MRPAEIAWRIGRSLRDQADRCLLPRRQRILPVDRILRGGGGLGSPGFDVCDMPVGQWAGRQRDSAKQQWYRNLIVRADRIARHRLDLFDLEAKSLGDPIDWNRDHKRDHPCPMTFSGTIDYRDVRIAGDCKFVWEPARHHQLVVLARAYRAGGDVRYARAVVEQLQSWLDQCPYGVGMHWRSGLELGIRLINWVWAMDLIRPSRLVDGELAVRLLNAIYRQVWEIDRKYSRGSSGNNHLIGEAAGVFIACSYFRNLKHAAKWRTKARRLLCEAIERQIYPDGGNREQSVGYHLFSLQFFTAAALVARWTGQEFPESYRRRLGKAFEFIGLLGEGGEHLPAFGDTDDGYVLDLCDSPRDHREWLAVAAVLFEREDLKRWAGDYGQTAFWLLGQDGERRFVSIAPIAPIAAIRQSDEGEALSSRALPQSGYYLLQSGAGPWRISAVFDCGPLGLAPMAGHGHADALSFTLRAFGRDVLVDPGTYDYFSYPRWRRYFRSTRAHNTVVIDGLDQSVMYGPFLWGRRANARCLTWQPTSYGGKVCAEHDGYARLRHPAIHRRTLVLDGVHRSLDIHDEIHAAQSHEITAYFHVAEHCAVRLEAANHVVIDTGAGCVTLALDRRMEISVYQGSDEPIAGWVSRGYHRKNPGTTLVGRHVAAGPCSFIHRIRIDRPAEMDGSLSAYSHRSESLVELRKVRNER